VIASTTITFPPRQPAVTLLLARQRRKRPLILLVEDDRMIADMYSYQLERDGYQVEVATDGKRGLEAIRSRHPDLVLLDLRLPVMEGFEVLESLATDATRPPVVILSNYGDSRMVSRGLALGARDYLVKSATTPTDLAEKVKAILPPGAPHL
jgi:two-component system, OmpR family, alkaline phosphatase synthesis response regulator PhoP